MSSVDEFRSRKIRLFKNGDVFSTGRKLVVSLRVYRNFEQFLHNISVMLNLPNGAVRKVYSIEGRPLRCLEDLQEGGIYVATAGEPLKRVDYNLSEEDSSKDGNNNKKEKVRRDDETTYTKPEVEPLFGPASKGYRVVVHLNGELKVPPLKLVLNYRNCKSFDHILGTVSNTWKRRITRLYDAKTWAKVKSLAELSDCQNLVGTGIENLKRIQYPIINPGAHTEKEEDTTKVLTFYPNGDAYHHGYTLTVKRSRFQTIKKLLESLNAVMDLVTGRATRIYSMDGRKIETIEQLLGCSEVEGRTEPPPDSDKVSITTPSTRFVLVSGDDPFLKIRYDVNAVRPHKVLSLAGYTHQNENMEFIRKPRARIPELDQPDDKKSEKQVRFEAGANNSKAKHIKVKSSQTKEIVVGHEEIEEDIEQQQNAVEEQNDSQEPIDGDIEEDDSAKHTGDEAFQDEALQHFNASKSPAQLKSPQQTHRSQHITPTNRSNVVSPPTKSNVMSAEGARSNIMTPPENVPKSKLMSPSGVMALSKTGTADEQPRSIGRSPLTRSQKATPPEARKSAIVSPAQQNARSKIASPMQDATRSKIASPGVRSKIASPGVRSKIASPSHGQRDPEVDDGGPADGEYEGEEEEEDGGTKIEPVADDSEPAEPSGEEEEQELDEGEDEQSGEEGADDTKLSELPPLPTKGEEEAVVVE